MRCSHDTLHHARSIPSQMRRCLLPCRHRTLHHTESMLFFSPMRQGWESAVPSRRHLHSQGHMTTTPSHTAPTPPTIPPVSPPFVEKKKHQTNGPSSNVDSGARTADGGRSVAETKPEIRHLDDPPPPSTPWPVPSTRAQVPLNPQEFRQRARLLRKVGQPSQASPAPAGPCNGKSETVTR